MHLPTRPDPGQLDFTAPVTAAFDAGGRWHIPGGAEGGRFAKPGVSGAKAAAVRAVRGLLAAERARASQDGASLALRADTPADLLERLDAPDRLVHARWRDAKHAVVEAHGRQVLVPWERFADPTPGEGNDLATAPDRALGDYVTPGVIRWAEKLAAAAPDPDDRFRRESALRNYAREPRAVRSVWADVAERNTGRRWIEQTLTSPTPDPDAIETLQQAHLAAVHELGNRPARFRRTTDTDNPFDPNTFGLDYAIARHGDDVMFETDSRVTSWFRTDGPYADAVGSQTPFGKVAHEGMFGPDRVLANIGDNAERGEYLIAESPTVVERLMAGQFPVVPEFGQANGMPDRPLAQRMLDRSARLADEEQIGADLAKALSMKLDDRVYTQAEMDGYPAPTQLEAGGPLVHQWTVRGQFMDGDTDDEIGEFQYVFSADRDSGATSVLLDTVSLYDEWQGSGLGSRFTIAAEKAFRSAGIDRITLHAAAEENATYDAGVYTWARAGFGWDLSTEHGRAWFTQNARHIAADLERLPDPPDSLDDDQAAAVRADAAAAAKSLRSLIDRVQNRYARDTEPGDVTPTAIANLGRAQGWPVGKLAMSPYTNRSARPNRGGNRQLDFMYAKPLPFVAPTLPSSGEANDMPPDLTLGERIDRLVDEPTVARIVDAFAAEDYAIYPVGGAVRDAVAGKEPNDIDLTTPAPPEVTKRLLDPIGAVYPLGEAHGTIVVNVGGEDYEVTTHRTERYDLDSRQPVTEFTTSLADDLARRDFTFNAMAVDPRTRELIDPFDGQADLAAGVVRSVGDPDERFSEDPLRIVRAVRFAAVNGWSIDPGTEAAAKRQSDRLAIVSTERFQTELDKVLKAPRPLALHDAWTHATNLRAAGRLFGPLAAAFTNPTPDGFVPIDDVPAPYRFPALVAAAGVEPHDLIAQMKRGSAEMRHVNDVLTAARLIRGGQPALALRRYPDDVIVAVEAITTYAKPMLAGFWVNRETLRAPLPIDGNDVKAIGIQGRDIRDALDRAEARFLASGGRITREQALDAARG